LTKSFLNINCQETLSQIESSFVQQTEVIKKVKYLRSEKGLSLSHLSNLTGFSKGYLSKIENGHHVPPFSTLQRIATALGVDLTYLFAPNTLETLDQKIVVVRKKERGKKSAELRATGIKRWPLADQKFGRNMDPYIIEIPSDNHQIFQFEGEEFHLVLKGRVELNYGPDRYILEEGDSVYLDANIPYTGRSIGEKPAKALMVQYHYKKITGELFSPEVLQLEIKNGRRLNKK
jgi:transcriptional regulator with XRE-family HTH domain